MTDPSPTTMTVGRQVLTALAVALVIMLAVGAVGVFALDRVSDAKDRVLDQEVARVVEAYRLELAAAERAVMVRNLLVTNDPEYRDRLEEADEEFRLSLSRLSGLVDAEERVLVEGITSAKADLDAVSDDVLARSGTGEVGLVDVAAAIRDELTPARQALRTVVRDFVTQEEAAIVASVADSDRTVRDTTRLLVGLAVLGLVLALAIGTWVTRSVSRRLTAFALSVDSASAQILAGTSQQAAAAAEQAAAVQETVATADELAQTADQSAGRARTVADTAQRAADVARDGSGSVEESSTAMGHISDQVDSIATTVVSLAERAQDISGIVRTVDDLSEQIHLLALNAAIEAARAGEHGRGFSVVASEVRSLADQSKRATNQIAGILGDIQHGTNTAVMATEEGNKSVIVGVDRIRQAGETIEHLAATVAEAAVAAEQIAASSGQQAVATAQISHAMRDMEETSQQNAAAARQAEEAARSLNEVAAGLKAIVGAR